jgi:formate/nitrite transporter
MSATVPRTMKPAEVAVALVEAGITKHKTRIDIIFFKGFLAGVMLSFGGLLSEVLAGGSTGLTASNPGMTKILAGFVFPVGLVMIVLQGQELVTGNMMIMPMAAIKRAIPWWSMLLNILVVTFANLAGSLFFAAILVHYSGIISADPYATYVKAFALKKASDPHWHQIFLRGIGCNWLVCIAIWQSTGAADTFSKVPFYT